MKALMKLAGAAKFFQKVERKKQVVTEDERMFQLEQALLAEEIGIDPQEIPGMRWFFDQTRLMKLPTHWRRQFTEGVLRYVNDATGEQARMHPNIDILKVFFYDRLANDQASATFVDKSRKLLPHIEEKLTKEMIGLSSKRKDAQKVNMKRDENGKVVTSKTERIAPDTTKLIASRNYLLKSIVDKVVTKSELWGYGKRARQYALLLDKTKNSKANFLEEEEEVETLELMDRIYTEANEFYESQYGQLNTNTTKLDEKISKLLTPETVIMCLHLLNVDKQQIQHYWFGRFMNCLLLPPMWRRHKGKSFDQFVYQPKNITFDLHPCFIYMLNQRNRFQIQFQTMPLAKQQFYLSFRQMEFTDFFERKFQVDMYALMDSHQKQLQKATRHQQSVNDWMIVQGLVEADIPQQHYMLAEQVEVFWRKRNFSEENYTPSVSPYGEVVWSHNTTGSCMERCPYRLEIDRFLTPICREIPLITSQDYKPLYDEIDQLDGFDQYFLQTNLQERISFLHHYVEGPQVIPHEIPKLYELDSYFDCIFSCPFDFERGLNLTAEDTPLWIEICQAQKITRILKQVISQLTDQPTIDRYYNIVKKYYLADTLRLEPENLDTVRATLTDSIQKEHLLKLIDFVFDIRKREERLGRNKPPPEPEDKKEQEDIFGSEQSQIDLNQYEPDEEDEDYPILPPDKAALIREGEPEDSNDGLIDQLEDNYKGDEPDSHWETITQKNEEDKSPQLTEEQLPSNELENQESIDKKINMARKKSLKVHKFNRTSTTRTNQIVERVKKIDNPDDRLRSKRDLLLSNLKKEQIPTKHNILRSPVKPTQVISQQSFNDTPSISMFNSVLSNYTNASVTEIIKRLPPKPVLPPTPVHIVEQSPSPIKLIKVMDTEDHETEESVLELTPIVQDSLRNDPVLRHINNFKDISDFTIAFGLSRTSTAEPDSRQFSRNNNLQQPSRLEDIDRQTIQSSERLFRTTSNFQKPSPSRLRKAGSPDKKLLEVPSNNFKRRCVSSTASHLLNCNAVTSRLTFSKIEVRKDLYLRSRGIFGDFLSHPAPPQ